MELPVDSIGEKRPLSINYNLNRSNDELDTNHTKSSNFDTNFKSINYKNGRKLEPAMFSYSNYYAHREKLPQHYNPLLQYLEKTEVKFHNDNLYEDSPIGLPTRSQ